MSHTGLPPAGPGGTAPGDRVRADAEAAQARLGETAQQVRTEASRATEGLKQEGAAIASVAGERAQTLAQDGLRMGADRAEGLVRAAQRAADAMEEEAPALARGVREAAGSVEGLARSLRQQNPGDLLQGVQDFARRQPAAFFGAAVLAGFAMARFAKASSDMAHARPPAASRPMAPGAGYGQRMPDIEPANGPAAMPPSGGWTGGAGLIG